MYTKRQQGLQVYSNELIPKLFSGNKLAINKILSDRTFTMIG